MKALSIKQPWASLIAHGIKDIENRTWRTHFRGRIYIHASAKIDHRHRAMNLLYTKAQWEAMPIDFNNKSISGTFEFSAIIGEVDIIDCAVNHPSIWAERTNLFEPGKSSYNWVLANPVLYDKPILNVKGKLSFWEFDPEELKKS